MIQTPMAYKFVVSVAMMAQVNYFAPRLHLPVAVPLNGQDIRFLSSIYPSAEASREIYGGRIQVGNYSFTFSNESHAIYRLADDGYQSFGIPMETGESSASLMERASKLKYTIGTNDVYRLATNWVAAMDIDLPTMERANPPHVNEAIFHAKRGLVPSPILSIDWKNTNSAGHDFTEVMVEMSAVSGELLMFRDGNGSFNKQKQPLISSLDKLLAVSDEEFLKYSDMDRSNLVVRFAGVHYDIPRQILYYATNEIPRAH